MAEKKDVEQKLKYLEKSLRSRKHIEVNVESPKEAYVQGLLARGGRPMGEVLLKACEMGGSKAFKRAMKEFGLDDAGELYRQREEAEIFPWERLDMGFRKEYLYAELKRAENLQPTLPCFDNCHRCGVC